MRPFHLQCGNLEKRTGKWQHVDVTSEVEEAAAAASGGSDVSAHQVLMVLLDEGEEVPIQTQSRRTSGLLSNSHASSMKSQALKDMLAQAVEAIAGDSSAETRQTHPTLPRKPNTMLPTRYACQTLVGHSPSPHSPLVQMGVQLRLAEQGLIHLLLHRLLRRLWR